MKSKLKIISKDRELKHVDRKHILKRENTPVSSVRIGYTLKLGNAIVELKIISKDREQTHKERKYIFKRENTC